MILIYSVWRDDIVIYNYYVPLASVTLKLDTQTGIV